jgi:protein-S-isoprenylcysteine O-methyltransferase
MPDLLEGFRALPPHGIAGLAMLLLYAIESEVRFGAKARSFEAGDSDRKSTLAVSLASAVPVLGFVLAMKATSAWVPVFVRSPSLPGMPGAAWLGVAVAAIGLGLRAWALLTLRERYTRTLMTRAEHAFERGGPYRRMRHPGYLGSLLCLNGIAMASGSLPVLLASLAATFLAYAYRIRVEDHMLLRAFGEPYAAYRREVNALVPLKR